MRRSIEITASVLGLIWLATIAIHLLFIAGLVDIAALIGAIVAQCGIFLVSGALLLVTNTRRPAGIDPNAPPIAQAVDPFGQTSDELRSAVLLPDRQPYGRRKHDDVNVVKRLIGKFEDEDALRPPPAETPRWALDLQESEAAGLHIPDRSDDATS